MRQHVEKMKIFIAEESLAKTSPAEIRKMREQVTSPWNAEKEQLNKDIKKEASSLINRIHIGVMRR